MRSRTRHLSTPESPAPRCLQFQLFGKFRVTRDDIEVQGLESHRVQELLAFLLLNRHRPFARGPLAETLWGDEATAGQAQKHLRQALWQLHTSLDPDPAAPVEPILLVQENFVQLNPRAGLSSDVAAFESVARAYTEVPGSALSADAVDAHHAAVQLYSGDLLEGCVQEWCLQERERLQMMYLVLLDKLIGWCEAGGAFETGLAYGAAVLQIDRAHERTHQRLMRLHYLAGDRAAALRQFERCATALDEDLGVRPGRRTLALHELIRADRDEEIASMSLRGRPASTLHDTATGVTPLQRVRVQLERVRAEVADLVQGVEREIRAVERSLGPD